MTINEIKELIQLIDQTSINDFQYQKDGYKIKIRKNTEDDQARSVAQVSSPGFNGSQKLVATENTSVAPSLKHSQELVSPIDKSDEVTQSTANMEGVPTLKTVEGKSVKSPLVGVYYASPSPTSPAFIQVGSQVKKGDVLCIVEAMKIMNEIVAEYDGVVTEICAENETLVEYGQTLVKIG